MNNFFSDIADNINEALKTRTGLTAIFLVGLLVAVYVTGNFWYDFDVKLSKLAHEKRSEISHKIEANQALLTHIASLTGPVFNGLTNILHEPLAHPTIEEERSNFLAAAESIREFYQVNEKYLEGEFAQENKRRIYQEMAKGEGIFESIRKYSLPEGKEFLHQAVGQIEDFEAAMNSIAEDIEGRLSELSEDILAATHEDEKLLEDMKNIIQLALIFVGILALALVFVQLIKIGKSEKLKHELVESKKTLELLDEIKNTITKSPSFSEALEWSMDVIRERLGWNAAHAYLVDRDAGKIVPSNKWRLKKEDEPEFEELIRMTEKTEFRIGEGIIGRVVDSQKSDCIPNIKKVDRELFHRIIEGAAHNIKGVWAFPILTEEQEVVAAFELFSFEEKKPNSENIRMMEHIGSQLGAAFVSKHVATQMEELYREISEKHEKLELNAKKLNTAKERMEKALLQKGKLVSLVSHDLRSPLATIINFSEILLLAGEKKTGGEEQKSILERIIGCCRDQLNMIDELLDASRLQSRGFDPNYTVEKAWFLAINAKSHLAPLAEKKGIKLSVDISEDLMITVDQLLFEGVLKNLISNAIKFCEKGDEIRISSVPEKPVTIVVSDTGIGIDEERLAKIFDYKGEAASTTPGTAGEKGTGLGLPLCRDIMEAHEGSIEVKSELGKGTRFFLHIPERRLV